jgi:hypothetical protein
MAEVDVVPAPAADEEDGSRDVSVSAPAASRSDEATTVRPPASIELALDDEAPDTVRRRIEPGPEAIGGARRESGVQAVTRGGSSLEYDGEAPAGVEPPSPEPLSLEPLSPERLSSARLSSGQASVEHASVVVAGEGGATPEARQRWTSS